jgi:nucleotide-binding universal stress UspA family protein
MTVVDNRRDRCRIVVGVDGSPSSEMALRSAADEAGHRRGVLQVVHCWLEAPAIRPAAQAMQPEVRRVLATRAAALVDVAATVARHRGYQIPVETHLLHGQPGPSLVDFSEDADLLVVGRHGHSRLAELVMGSVSRYCVRHAHCPVAVIPLPSDRAREHELDGGEAYQGTKVPARWAQCPERTGRERTDPAIRHGELTSVSQPAG